LLKFRTPDFAVKTEMRKKDAKLEGFDSIVRESPRPPVFLFPNGKWARAAPRTSHPFSYAKNTKPIILFLLTG